MIDYDDVRLVAAIAAAGGVRGAQARLGTHIATIYRQLRDLERRIGGALFERLGDTLVPTGRAEPFLEAADDLRDRLAKVERRVAALDDRLVGTLNVTTADTLLETASACLKAFSAAHPGIALSLEVNNGFADLGRREADIAIRPTLTPPETLVGRRVARFSYAVYAADVSAAGGWIGFDAVLSALPAAQWLKANVTEDEIRLRVNSLTAAAAAAEAGWGRALLPDYLGAARRLARAGETIDALASELWVLYHPDLRGNPRVRAFSDFSAKWLRARLNAGAQGLGQPNG
ncbi:MULTISPECIES: LysR family transcriptional regulator [Mesorhizobium]|uniref:DNA-binding transcriptional LysR family regulator n=1 Tax=Mesorhizobium shonense TaxID=1209948 RepID=A0ABV2I1L9_9HYPH|nr:LysR family transcriptional regulator [Mesorhizobium sp.]RWD96904.1 MAG: LysR family transcriptional regulator [Mesorhizobium sp.]TIS44190.1 MAG: LysR family transcriptional regulator [Mesorhizobium sp.]